MRRLRSPAGCPWDRRQTHRSIRINLIEETYEVIDAIDRNDPQALKEELGDLLLHVLLHAQIEEERGNFRLEDVFRSISEKLVRRHPHVFGRRKGISAARAVEQWEVLKHRERGNRGALKSVPRALPALIRAVRVQNKAARLGFEWRRFGQAMEKLDEEMEEFRSAVRGKNRGAARREIGDVFFALAKVAKFMRLNPEDELNSATNRFVERFSKLERAVRSMGTRMDRMKPEELYRLWRDKTKTRRGRTPTSRRRSSRPFSPPWP